MKGRDRRCRRRREARRSGGLKTYWLECKVPTPRSRNSASRRSRYIGRRGECLPTQRHHTNSAWQVFCVIAFNLVWAMQAGTAERRSTYRKRRAIRPFKTIQTLRYGFINRAGLLVQPGGRQILDVGNNSMVLERFKTIESALAA